MTFPCGWPSLLLRRARLSGFTFLGAASLTPQMHHAKASLPVLSFLRRCNFNACPTIIEIYILSLWPSQFSGWPFKRKLNFFPLCSLFICFTHQYSPGWIIKAKYWISRHRSHIWVGLKIAFFNFDWICGVEIQIRSGGANMIKDWQRIYKIEIFQQQNVK